MKAIITNLFVSKAQKLKKIQRQREAFSTMMHFKRDTDYITNMVINSMQDMSTLMKCRETVRKLVMNYRKRWINSIYGMSYVSTMTNETKGRLQEMIDEYAIILNDAISEGFVTRELSYDAILLKSVELFKCYARTFEVALPAPRKISEAEKNQFFDEVLAEGDIISYRDAETVSLREVKDKLLKVVSLCKDDDGWGQFICELDGVKMAIHIGDIHEISIHDKMSVFWH